MDGAEAACWVAVEEGRASPDDWFPTSKSNSRQRRHLLAMEICSSCPIQSECLDWALHHSQSQYSLYGIWGGISPSHRKQLARSAA